VSAGDLLAVRLVGVTVDLSAVTWQSSTRMLLLSPSVSPGSGGVFVNSTAFGSSETGQFTANFRTVFLNGELVCGSDSDCLVAPNITGVVPNQGRMTGGFVVTVTGLFLGANDILSVTLGGVTATAITWQSASRVLVVAGATGTSRSGAVVLSSTAFGIGSGLTFTYVPVRIFIRFAFLLLIISFVTH
jgi:hypothetical protein